MGSGWQAADGQWVAGGRWAVGGRRRYATIDERNIRQKLRWKTVRERSMRWAAKAPKRRDSMRKVPVKEDVKEKDILVVITYEQLHHVSCDDMRY